VLFVGNRAGHKNFGTLLRALAASPHLVKSHRIACFGGGKLTADEKNWAYSLGIPENALVHLPGSDAVLGAAYANATVFVYPSLYEGFGLPPLEAMSAGCPVICSNTSSLPEVVGEAAITVDPESVEALRDAIERVVHSAELRQDLISRGHAQRQNFTREKTAAQTLAIYRSVL
jgi:glycosyltransferase involved in cell wall biosynthesis